MIDWDKVEQLKTLSEKDFYAIPADERDDAWGLVNEGFKIWEEIADNVLKLFPDNAGDE